jgi:phosphatidate cytidylyltransferase
LKELILRTLTGITLIVLVAGSILLGPFAFIGMTLVLYALSVNELNSLFHKLKSSRRWMQAIPGFLLLLLSFATLEYQLHPAWFIVPAGLWLFSTLRWGFNLSGLLSFLWLALPYSSFLALGWLTGDYSYHFLLPLAVIALVWLNDTFAYLTGSLLGRHQMTPVLSPGKTWEGFAGGVIFTLLGGWITWRITGTLGAGTWLAISLIIGSLGLAGDLFESGLKRTVKVKNTGNLLPGHGGILDRFDSLLFVAPAVVILILLIKLLL